MRRALTVLLVVAGCGGDEPAGIPAPVVRELPEPALRMVAPTALRAGDELTVFGKGFADKEIGETRLTFDGVYQTTSGVMKQVKLEVVPTFKNQGVATWTFGPNIPFGEEDTGSFRGVLRARNIGLDGQTKDGVVAIGVELQVLPSILIRQLRPTSAGCAVGSTDTIEDTRFMVEVKTVGLKSGSSIAPLRYVYTFLKETFSFSGTFASALALDPEALFPKKGPVSVIDDVHNGTISTLGSAPRNIYVYKGGYTPGMASLPSSVDNLFGLTYLTTTVIPETANSVDAIMNVVAIDSTGQQATRAIPLRIWTPIEVDYTGAFKTARSFDPVPVSGCIPGGDIGRDVTYSETSSETRTRTFTVSGKISGGVDIKVVRLNAEFGMDVQAQVSSSKSQDLQITGKILPKEFGVFYRQTLQMERRAKLISHDGCGNTQALGEVIVTDWVWSPDLAKGRACPPLPTSNLQPGQIFQ